MAHLRYKKHNFGPEATETIDRARVILEQYAEQGYDLTLRQLYYQFVSKGWLPNKQREYDRLGVLVSNARLAGLLDWDHIVDRARETEIVDHWRSPAAIMAAAARSYAEDKWANQPQRVEVWIEKDALSGVIEGPCRELDIPYLACKGYTSQSEMWRSAQRIVGYLKAGQQVTILHMGDHDPSGIDMTRDIRDRLELFLAHHAAWGQAVPEGQAKPSGSEAYGWVAERFQVERIALTWEQVQDYDPPPNPAKMSDSRAADYVANYGHESWELDALDPSVLDALVRDNVGRLLDDELWDEAVAAEDGQREALTAASAKWPEVAAWLKDTTEGGA